MTQNITVENVTENEVNLKDGRTHVIPIKEGDNYVGMIGVWVKDGKMCVTIPFGKLERRKKLSICEVVVSREYTKE